MSDGEWKAFGANCWEKGKDAGMRKEKMFHFNDKERIRKSVFFWVFLGYNLVHDNFFCYEVISQSDHLRSFQRRIRLQ